YGGFFRFDLSWISTTWMGAITEAVKAWSGPLFEAYLAGAWLLHWTPDTLFWVTKPRLSIERPSAQLHNTGGPAVESLGKLYFWHGIHVPERVILTPDEIPVEAIDSVPNIEIRRVMIERIGIEQYIKRSCLKPIQSDDFGTLYRKEQQGDEPLVVV